VWLNKKIWIIGRYTYMSHFFNTFDLWISRSTFTYLHLHLFYKCRTMADYVANKKVYRLLLSKWRLICFKILDKDLQKPKVKKMYYWIKTQSKLLVVFGFKDFKTLFAFKNVGEINDLCHNIFITKLYFKENVECYLAHVLNLPI